jgi:heptosyltransferase II
MRILIELPSWLGDTVMSTPAIESLLDYYEKSEVIIIGTNVSIEIFKNHPKISEVRVLEKKYSSYYHAKNELGVFDVFFSFRGSFRARILKILISSKKKYQYHSNKYQNRHQVEKYNDFVSESLDLKVTISNLNIAKDIELTSMSPKLLLGINPGAKYGSSKRWYPEEFAKVAIELSDQFDVIIFGGPDEVDIAFEIEKILNKKGVFNYQNLAGKTSIDELINRLSILDLFITGDSGPMHIAASFQIPTVTIFGPTNHAETSQWMNDKSVIVKKNLDCQPCMKRICPLIHHNCMRLIKAEEVLKAVNSLQIENY